MFIRISKISEGRLCLRLLKGKVDVRQTVAELTSTGTKRNEGWTRCQGVASEGKQVDSIANRNHRKGTPPRQLPVLSCYFLCRLYVLLCLLFTFWQKSSPCQTGSLFFSLFSPIWFLLRQINRPSFVKVSLFTGSSY